MNHTSLFPRGLLASAAAQDRRPLLLCRCAGGGVVLGGLHGLADCTARPCAGDGAAAHHIFVTVQAPVLRVSMYTQDEHSSILSYS
jgi:hypothetical protein